MSYYGIFPSCGKKQTILGFCLGKCDFKTDAVVLWKSESPISKTLVFWKLLRQFVRIKSMHEGLWGFL